MKKPKIKLPQSGEMIGRLKTHSFRVGGYSAESAGEAWFDDVEITAVDAAPDGVAVASFAPVSNDAEEAEAESSDAEESDSALMPLLKIL